MTLPARLAVLLPLLITLAPASAAPPDRATIDTVVREAMKAWQVPGVAVAIVRGDETVYLAGHGVCEIGTDRRVTPDTLFPLASCTKAFTTSAMALLVDEDKMHWDDPVRKHLPSFHLSGPHADADVRLRDLVSHRTGVRGHDLLWYRAPWSQEEQIRRIGLVPLDKPFRTSFQYQSTMFTAAGHAVTHAAGHSWADVVQHRLLDPLGMKATVLTSKAAEASADRALPHRPGPDGRLEVVPSYPMPVPDAAGSIHSSARDLARWLRFHLNEGTHDGRRLVSAAALRETHTPQIVVRLDGLSRDMNPDTHLMSYGMGWLVRDHRGQLLLEHAGLIDGFRAHLALVPKEKFGVALLCNRHETWANLAISNTLVELQLGLTRRDWNAHLGAVARREVRKAAEKARARQARREAGAAPTRSIGAYAGTYEEPAYGMARVVIEEGRLLLRWSSFQVALEPLDGETFVAASPSLGQAEVTFVGNERGVTAMTVGEPLGVTFRRKP